MKKIYFLIAELFISHFLISQNQWLTSYSCTVAGSASIFLNKSAFAIDNNGIKYIGLQPAYSAPYQLVRYNGTGWDSLPHVPSHRVNALAIDPANNLWIGTDSGLAVYNGSSYTIYNTSNSGLAANKVYCIASGEVMCMLEQMEDSVFLMALLLQTSTEPQTVCTPIRYMR